MSLSREVREINRVISRNINSTGFTTDTIRESLVASSGMDINLLWDFYLGDLEDVKRVVRESCSNVKPMIEGDANKVLRAFFCNVDSRWLTVFINDRIKNMETVYGYDVVALRNNILYEKPKPVIVKVVDSFYEEFVGLQLNSIMEGVPAFVYTYGHRNCKTTESEVVGISCFPRLEEDKDAVQLITEYVDNSETLASWLSRDQQPHQIRSVFFQVISNLLEANRLVNFVHGDLHAKNIVIEPKEEVAVPVGGQLRHYPMKLSARIIDYGFSSVAHEGIIYSPYTNPIANVNIWSDVVKMLLSSYMHSTENNKGVLRSSWHDTLGIKGDMEDYLQLLEPVLSVPPNSSIYSGLQKLESVAESMSREFTTVTSPSARNDFGSLSPLAKSALGLKKDIAAMAYATFKFVETGINLANIFNGMIAANRLIKPLYIRALHDVLDTVQFVARPASEYAHAKERALYLRKLYEESFDTWLLNLSEW